MIAPAFLGSRAVSTLNFGARKRRPTVRLIGLIESIEPFLNAAELKGTLLQSAYPAGSAQVLMQAHASARCYLVAFKTFKLAAHSEDALARSSVISESDVFKSN